MLNIVTITVIELKFKIVTFQGLVVRVLRVNMRTMVVGNRFGLLVPTENTLMATEYRSFAYSWFYQLSQGSSVLKGREIAHMRSSMTWGSLSLAKPMQGLV